MWYESSKMERLAIIEMQCPICGETANIRIDRQVEFDSVILIFNFWAYKKIIATCGNCHESFEIKKKEAYEVLDSVRVSVNRSNIKKNLLSLSIPIIIIYILSIVL